MDHNHHNEHNSHEEPHRNENQENSEAHIEHENHSNSANHTTSEHTEPTTYSKPKKQGSGGGKYLLSGLVGGIIAAVIVAVLFTTNIIPVNNSSGNDGSSANTTASSDSPEVIKTMASENADEATNLEEATEAVVGVINLQQQSVWTKGQEAGAGSGIIYKKENGKAYIVTNHHVVDGASEVEVALDQENRIKAKVLGSDRLTDLAVLQVDGDKIDTVAKLGSSKDLKVGETVFAIGNPLGMNFADSLTKGIISGLDRSVSIDTNGDQQPDWVTEVIQTDAAINPGNSGGALVNAEGKVIGINSMKIAKQTVEGIGFAIPINAAQPVMKQLEENGEIARPFIGVSTASLNQVPPQYRDRIQLPNSVEGGMVIAQVEPGSPADKAGLQQFDIITKIDGNKITSLLDLRQYLYKDTEIGETVKLELYRNGKAQTVELELVARKDK